MTATVKSSLRAEAVVSVDFGDEPVVVKQGGRKAFCHRATFKQAHASAVYGTGRGFFAKKDGTEGNAVANLYSVRISDLPEPVARAVAAGLRAQLDRVLAHPGSVVEVEVEVEHGPVTSEWIGG